MIRYQYSRKIKEDIIVVEHTDETWESFMEEVGRAESAFGAVPVQTVIPQVPQASQTPQVPQAGVVQASLVCQICGGKAEIKSGVSKLGNEYKIFRCLANPELDKAGGHSHFMK